MPDPITMQTYESPSSNEGETSKPIDLVATVRQALAQAIPGPWRDEYVPDDSWTLITGQPYDGMTCPVVATCNGYEPDPNAHLIAHAPEWLAALCDEVERMRDERDELIKFTDEQRSLRNADIQRATAQRARLDAAEKVVEAAGEVRAVSDSRARDIEVFAAIDGLLRTALDAWEAHR